MWIEVRSSAPTPAAACMRSPEVAKLVAQRKTPAKRNVACSAIVPANEASATSRIAGACHPQTASNSSNEASNGQRQPHSRPGSKSLRQTDRDQGCGDRDHAHMSHHSGSERPTPGAEKRPEPDRRERMATPKVREPAHRKHSVTKSAGSAVKITATKLNPERSSVA